MKKPNQIIDEITEVIYPPTEAIVPQLNTIKQVAASTVRIYESTQEIHTIMPNLDMIQRAIDYLRGAPMIDELRPDPEDFLNPEFYVSTSGINIFSKLNKDGEYDVSIVGSDVEPQVTNSDLFGEMDFKAIELDITIPVICGKTYLVTQTNSILKHYQADPYVHFDTEELKWIKEKTYDMSEDEFTYALLLGEGRATVKVVIIEDEDESEPVVFNISSHLHFKKELPEPEPEPEDPKEQEGEKNEEEGNSISW